MNLAHAGHAVWPITVSPTNGIYDGCPWRSLNELEKLSIKPSGVVALQMLCTFDGNEKVVFRESLGKRMCASQVRLYRVHGAKEKT
jgi:hypothetical protein